MKTRFQSTISILMTIIFCLSVLTGCGSTGRQERIIPHPDEIVVNEPQDNSNIRDFISNISTAAYKSGVAFNSIEAIQEVAKIKATCQTDKNYCFVDIEDPHNPYDIKWDYGSEWDKYVNLCDWSLVFDVDYYKKAYPVLTILYNNNDELLFEHFATIGVHEGRQGCKNFNVEAYLMNCDYKVYDGFRNAVSGAYIYYMLHYNKEKDVNTVTRNDGKPVRTKLFTILTMLQRTELSGVNQYRQNAGLDDVEIDAELCALANYRAYMNRINGSKAGHGHDWARDNKKTLLSYLDKVFADYQWLDENTITKGRYLVDSYIPRMYFDSPEHKEAMLKKDGKHMGTSNLYYSPGDKLVSHFDLFTDG